jgi:hypothetical protein
MKAFRDIQQALYDLEQEVLVNTTLYPARELGLDERCGAVYVGEDYIATTHRRTLDYYGGFEYVDSEYILALQTFTVYSIEDSRVLQALQTLEHNHD